MSRSGSRPRGKRIPPTPRCTARVKTCPKCQYRYVRGDKAEMCPNCRADRRCKSRAMFGTPVCRMHGAGGALNQAQGAKFRIAHQIMNAFNRLMTDPDILNLSQEIAAVTARTDELMGMLDSLDSRGAHEEITKIVDELGILMVRLLADQGAAKETFEVPARDLRHILSGLRKAVEPVNVEQHLWRLLTDNFELTRRLNETERRWLVSNEGLLPIVFVLEVLMTIQRLTLKYIRNPEDRAAYSAEFRAAVPVQSALPPPPGNE